MKININKMYMFDCYTKYNVFSTHAEIQNTYIY